MSFLVNGANFWPTHYYRDDALARSVLAAGRKANPVLVTGLRRIGKSWFLRRFEQIFLAGATRHFSDEGTPTEQPLEPGMPQRIQVLDGGSETLEQDLDKILDGPCFDLLLAVDELEKLVGDPSRAHLVHRIVSASCPLVLVGAPVLLELASARAPALRTFFEERCIQKVLRPLSRGERKALALQTCDPGQGVPAGSVAMATWFDWGGHPLVLQQIGALLRERGPMSAQELLDAAHALLNLGAPRYGVSLAGDSGLTVGQRDVLARVAARQDPGDEHAAVVLLEHGAIVRRRGVWAVENCVLRRHLQGSLEPTQLLRAAVEPVAPTRAFTWIHLSDLHFGAGTLRHRFDHKAVMRAIERDLVAHSPGPVDRIFVTGDIAFSAREDEYKLARPWFTKIAEATGAGETALRFVPGNHDVDRDAAKKVLARCVHLAVRGCRVELDQVLADGNGRAALLEKLAAYCAFVAATPGHPAPLGGNQLDWFEAIPAKLGGHGAIRIVGLSSVWISDDDDGNDGNKESPFVANMMLGRAPLDATFGEAAADEIILALSHHPQEWLHKEALAVLDVELARLAHVQLCGHVHDANASVTERFGRRGKAVRYLAGAAHGDPSEAAKHGYAWGAIRFEPRSGTWQAGWAPRVYVDGAMCADSTGRELVEGFVWKTLDCPWPAPGKSA